MPRVTWDSQLVVNGKPYPLLLDGDAPAHERHFVPTQEGAIGKQIERRVENHGRGWGESKFLSSGGIDYADVALTHRRLSFLPGATYTDRTPATPAIGRTHLGEFWDGTDANRRIIIVSPRHVYEIDSTGTVSTNDLGVNFTTARGMTRGALFKTGSIATRYYIARQSTTATDYFVVRTAANTYSLTTANFRADALAVGKDSEGDSVLWIVDPDANGGELRQSVVASDPQSSGSYGTTTYPIGEVSSRANDVMQQAKRMVVARVDGFYSFDNKAKSIPLTSGLEQSRDQANGMFVKDFNGAMVAPHVTGLIWIDGLEWGYCGPVSSNPHARNLRNIRETAFCWMGNYAYAAGYNGTDSYIWLGVPRREGDPGTGTGMFVWHGPFASVDGKEITDLRVSTVWGKKLWVGHTTGFGTIDLEDDFSPTPNATSGYIYFPEGQFDGDGGPGVPKDVQAFEFIAPASAPMDASNTWAMQVNFDDGNGWQSPGTAASGVYSRKEFTTEKAGRRPRFRLAYTNNGTAELETVIISGLERPDGRWHDVFRIIAKPRPHTPRGRRILRTPTTIAGELEALRVSGWTGLIRFGETSLNVKIVDVRESTVTAGSTQVVPSKYIEVEFAEVP